MNQIRWVEILRCFARPRPGMPSKRCMRTREVSRTLSCMISVSNAFPLDNYSFSAIGSPAAESLSRSTWLEIGGCSPSFQRLNHHPFCDPASFVSSARTAHDHHQIACDNVRNTVSICDPAKGHQTLRSCTTIPHQLLHCIEALPQPAQ